MKASFRFQFVLFAAVFCGGLTASAARVDLHSSVFQWKASKKFVGTHHTGKIFLKSAEVEMKSGRIGHAKLVMDMKSITDEDLSGKWNAKLLHHLKSSDFFDVAKFPTATLEINRQIDAGTVAGRLTIKDKTRPVKLKFHKKGGTYSGKLTFNRTRFGVIYGSKSFFKRLVADHIINDNITVDFKVVTH